MLLLCSSANDMICHSCWSSEVLVLLNARIAEVFHATCRCPSQQLYSPTFTQNSTICGSGGASSYVHEQVAYIQSGFHVLHGTAQALFRFMLHNRSAHTSLHEQAHISRMLRRGVGNTVRNVIRLTCSIVHGAAASIVSRLDLSSCLEQQLSSLDITAIASPDQGWPSLHCRS